MTIMEKLGISSDKWVNYKEDDFDQITWTGDPQCTKQEWETAKVELQAEYDSKQYQRDRATSYPSIQEQLDMQYWDAVNGTKKWQEAIAKVKTDNPKPSE